jgi:hypothetical protein
VVPVVASWVAGNWVAGSWVVGNWVVGNWVVGAWDPTSVIDGLKIIVVAIRATAASARPITKCLVRTVTYRLILAGRRAYATLTQDAGSTTARSYAPAVSSAVRQQ